MALRAAAGLWSQVCAGARTVRRCAHGALAIALLLGILSFAPSCRADPVKGEATFSAEKGYARLMLKFSEDVASEVVTAGSIVVIRFERPVDLPVDRLAEAVPDYVTSARRDPDGTAIRLSLARRVTINTMSAAERTFVDFLPDNWNGPPPTLPVEVVRELAERARAAERALRHQRAETAAKKRPPIRVRALVQPTFVRFVFEMPDGVGASSALNDQKLTILFNKPLTFDLADAEVAAPPNIASIKQRVEGDQTAVDVALIGDVDTHSFREDRNYIIDVAFQRPEKAKQQILPLSQSMRGPALASAASTAPSAPENPDKTHSEEISPPTSETIAREMKMGGKPPETMPPPAPLDSATPESATRASSEVRPAKEAPVAEAPIAPAGEVAKPVPVETTAPVASEAPKSAADQTPNQTDRAPKPLQAAEPIPEPKTESNTAARPADESATVSAWRDSDGLR